MKVAQAFKELREEQKKPFDTVNRFHAIFKMQQAMLKKTQSDLKLMESLNDKIKEV